MPDTQTHLLLVGQDDAVRTATAARLADHGVDVVQARSGEEATALLHDGAFDVIVADLLLPGVDSRQVVDIALDRDPDIITIVVVSDGTVRDAVDVVKRGATSVIARPFTFDELLHVLDGALERRRLKRENAYLHQQLDTRFGVGAMVGNSAVIRDVRQLIETVAPTNATVLIVGEPGTGKEVVARAIHQTSPRRAHRFVALDCGAIPAPLLEAELFGHARGAATGTGDVRDGRLAQSDRGTLFLDAVETLSPALQMKLLRVLQEREFERVGDNRRLSVDTRVVGATHTDLARRVRTGTFREDLYYRLNVISIPLPALRDRKDDIPLLVQHFLSAFTTQVRGSTSLSSASSVPSVPSVPSAPSAASVASVASVASAASAPSVAHDAMRHLMAYSWPGNVRQLENAIERAVALTGRRTHIDVEDLPAEVQAADVPVIPTVDFPDEGVDLPALVTRIEQDLIQRALKRTGGNKAAAAGLLGLKRTTLVEKLKRMD